MNTVSLDFCHFISARTEHVAELIEKDCEFANTCTEIKTISEKAYELAQDNFALAERTAYTKGLFDGLELSRELDRP